MKKSQLLTMLKVLAERVDYKWSPCPERDCFAWQGNLYDHCDTCSTSGYVLLKKEPVS